MSLSERIKRECERNNLSIRALEQKAGLTNGQIGRWEQNKPSYDKVLSVANILNVSIEWLITGKDPESLSEDEKTLITNYRTSSPEGKGSIQALASYQASISGVSISKNGKTGTDN